MNTYKVQMYIKGTGDDVVSLRKSLAQSVYDEFELGSVFGVIVELSIPHEELFNRIMALCIVALEDGLNEKQIHKLMDSLPADKKYMQIEFHENNSSAYGFIESEYYQIHNYDPAFLAEQINAILDDQNLENPKGEYMTPDGRQFYMGYFND